MHPFLNHTNGHMALLAVIGLALMGLSVPGRALARLIGPLAFVVGLALITWALFRHRLVAELILFGLVTVAAVAERKWTARPSLSFGEVEITPPLRLVRPHGQIVGQGLYCHVEVRASTTLDVRGEAIKLERKTSSGAFEVEDDFKTPHELRWDKAYVEPDDFRRETIHRDVPGRLNLVDTASNDPGMTHLCVPVHGPGMGLTKLSAGDYRLTVRVSAPDARHADAQFLIHAGEWNEVGVEKVSQSETLVAR